MTSPFPSSDRLIISGSSLSPVMLGPRLVLLLLCLTFLESGLTAQDRPEIRPHHDPKLATTRVDAVALRDSKVLWGTGAGLCLQDLTENKTGAGTTWWHSRNSPLPAGKEFPVVAFFGPELLAANRDGVEGRGLYRFDGTAWQHFDSRNDEMLSNLVTAMAEDEQGRFWIGYEERGIDRFQDREVGKTTLRRFKSVKAKSVKGDRGLLEGPVLALAASGQRVWIGTPSGLCAFDPGKPTATAFQRWIHPGSFPSPDVQALLPDGTGKVVAAGDFGLLLPQGDSWTLIDRRQGMVPGQVRGFAREGDRIWIGTARGLQFFRNGAFSRVLGEADGLPSEVIRGLAARTLPDGTSEVLVGTETGACILHWRR